MLREDTGEAEMPENNEQKYGHSARGTLVGKTRKWLPLLVLLAFMALAFSLGLHNELTLSNLIMQRQELAAFVEQNILLALLTFLALYTVGVALSVPGASFLTIAGGFLFGWVLGGLTAIFGATLGACAVFLVARSSFGEVLTKKAGPFLSRLAEGFRSDAVNYLLFLRLTPVFPFWLVNIAPAMFQMPLLPYALVTLVGIVPGTFAFAFIGSGLDSVIEAQEAAHPGCAAAGSCEIDVGALVTPQLLIAFAALGVASLIPVVYRKIRAR